MGAVDPHGFHAASSGLCYCSSYIWWGDIAAKCEMRDLHSAASHHQVGELAEDAGPLEPMPEPMCAA